MSIVGGVRTFASTGTVAHPEAAGFGMLQVFSLAEAGTKGLEFKESDRGTYLYSGYRIFRTGTFRDSMGELTTWEPEHLQQMVFHFELLRDRGILPNPIVRHNHPSIFGGGGEVQGYITGLKAEEVDGTNYLLADFEITEPEAHERIQRGTYRARSAEVGHYVTNEEAMFWPVVKGFAFVDLPAVEGLFQKGDYAVLRTHRVKEHQVTGENNNEGAGNNSGTPPETQPTPATTHSFRVNGEQVSDFSAVQRHIDALESEVSTLREAQRQQVEVNRKDFVQSLAHDGKIFSTADHIKNFENMVVGMTDEQFQAFQAAYKDAPPMGLLGPKGSNATPNGQPPTKGGPDDKGGQYSQEDTDLAIVERHRLANMKVDDIKKTASFRRLEAAGKAPTLV